jgi:hypothetical protein
MTQGKNEIDKQECKNTGRHVAVANTFVTMAPNIETSVWNSLRVILLVPRISRWLLEFWTIVLPL